MRPRFSLFFECKNPQDPCLAMGEQPALGMGQGSLPEPLGSLSGHGWEASSLQGGISGKAASVWLACLFSHGPLNSGGKDHSVVCGPLEPH